MNWTEYFTDGAWQPPRAMTLKWPLVTALRTQVLQGRVGRECHENAEAVERIFSD
jgi:hypothetical protein